MVPNGVAVIGAGMIGRGWIVAFARAGMQVSVWSRSRETSELALDYIREMTPQLAQQGLLGGRDPATILEAISLSDSLEEAVASASYVQENVPENIELKRDILSRLDAAALPEAIIASSVSALLPSRFMDHLAGRHRFIVAHPLNPPHLIPATEIVPSPWTTPEVIDRTCEVLVAAGQRPVILRKEIDGYVVNRLQGALLNEAFRLVADGYASSRDVDTAIRDGLSLRWSFMGPFETIDLNAPKGVRDYVERYDGMYQNLLAQMREPVDWTGPVLDVIERERRAVLPADRLHARQLWRDTRLGALAAHRTDVSQSVGD